MLHQVAQRGGNKLQSVIHATLELGFMIPSNQRWETGCIRVNILPSGSMVQGGLVMHSNVRRCGVLAGLLLYIRMSLFPPSRSSTQGEVSWSIRRYRPLFRHYSFPSHPSNWRLYLSLWSPSGCSLWAWQVLSAPNAPSRTQAVWQLERKDVKEGLDRTWRGMKSMTRMSTLLPMLVAQWRTRKASKLANVVQLCWRTSFSVRRSLTLITSVYVLVPIQTSN